MVLEDRLYASSEVAKILGVSRRTLYRYLESGTLGSMHLPSGRHRFTKDQVEAFLVKTYGTSSLKTEPVSKKSVGKIEVEAETQVDSEPIEEEVLEVEEVEEVVRPSVFSKINIEIKQPVVEEVVAEVEKEEEEEEEEEGLEEEVQEVEPEEEIEVEEPAEEKQEPVADVEQDKDVDEVVEDLKKTLSSLFSDSDDVEEAPVTKVSSKDSFKFYASSISDLKKLAKTVKVASENSNVQYAFTGQAGASLFGEVSPFGQLHLYIRKNDMLFFEKRFDLEETTVQDDSNVALKVVDELPEHTIVMGFKVVNLATLKKDLVQLGDTATAGNLEG